MASVYRAKGNIYLNLTNRCSSDCCFCVAGFSRGIYGYGLRLEAEPDVDEVLHGLEAEFLEGPAAEVVFCGFGEPTMRLDAILKITEWLKLRRVPSRLDTNGHGSLINPGRDVPGELARAGLDRVSVSLVAHNSEVYNQLSRPVFSKAFRAVLQFAAGCIKEGIKVRLTVVDLPEVDIEACRSLAKKMGADFYVRPLISAGSGETED